MMTTNQVIISIVLISLVTMAIRFLPFIVFKGKDTPYLINKLGHSLPYAAIGMLVVYCLKDISFSGINEYLPTVIAIVIVGGSYVYKRNTLISIVLGTLSYMAMVQWVFI